jgi:hypothetical protein
VLRTKTSNQFCDTWGAPARKHDCARTDMEGFPSALAHPAKPLLVHLNRDWLVTEDSRQWIVKKRKGNSRRKNAGWESRSFCHTREGLLRCVSASCGTVNSDALRILNSLPEHHVDR